MRSLNPRRFGPRWSKAGAGAFTIAVMVGTAVALGAGSARAAEPGVSLSSTNVRPGSAVVVSLQGWDAGAVTVSVCGNEARRGSPDCDLSGSVAAGPFSSGRPEVIEMMVRTPPAPCPCVVRATNRGNAVVRSVPITVVGHPVAPVVGPVAPISPLEVSARVLDMRSGLWSRARSWLGGRTSRTVEIEIRNVGAVPVSQVSVNAAVGRDRLAGEPLLVPDIAPIGAGEVRTYVVPVQLSAPAYGRYVVFGSVLGPGAPVRFEVGTSTTPGLLVAAMVALPALGVGAAVRARLRRRDERRLLGSAADAPWWPPPEPEVTSARTAGKQWLEPTISAPVFPMVPRVTPEVARPEVATRPRGPLKGLFESRRAAWSCAATTALFLVVIVVAAGCSSSERQTQANSDDADVTSDAAEARLPMQFSVDKSDNLTDGEAVKLTVKADSGSQIFGFEAFLCAGDAVFRSDADIRPTVTGKCVTKPLSPISDAYQEVRGQAPFDAVESTFRAGIGIDEFTTRDGRPVKITCGKSNPCQVVLKVQYPQAFGFLSQKLSYR